MPRAQTSGVAARPGAAPVRVGLDYRPALLTSSGIGRAVRELARALAERSDVELHLFAHSLAPARRDDPPPPGARMHRLPVPGRSLPALARLGLDAPLLCGRVPLFHWTDYVHPPVRRGPTVLTLHDVAFAVDPAFHGAQSETLLARSRAAARRADAVVAPTHATAAAAARVLGVAPARCHVVPFGADHARPSRRPAPRSDRYLLALGTLEPRKNHLVLLQAWRRLPAPRPTLVVAGRPGWCCDEAIAALRQEAARGDVVWLPGARDGEVFDLLQHAAALVYPSRYEGFGFPPLEALALGTPVVAGDCAALRETLADAALFCEPRDPDALAAAIDAVLRDGALRRTLRARGARRSTDFRWEHCARGYAAVYRAALEAATA